MSKELTMAAQQALEALKNVTDYDQINAASRALQAALTQRPAAQEVARFEAGCNVLEYLKQEGAPYRITSQMLIALHGDPEGRPAPQQATPEPVQLDVVRQAIEERDAMESSYHALAQSMVYEGNSVSWWHSKAKVYRNAIDDVWSALKAAGICADGKKTCADGVRELAATPTQQAAGEPVVHTYASTQATNCAGCGKHKHTPLRIDAMGGYVCLTCIDNKLGSLLGEFGYPEPDDTHPAPAVPEGFALVPVEPTEEMAATFMNPSMSSWRQRYTAMLAAAQAKGVGK